MRDYFGALVSRVLQPERSVQPRRRVPFEAVEPPMLDAPAPFEQESGQAPGRTGARRSAADDLAPAVREGTVGRRPEAQAAARTIPATRASRAASGSGGADVPRIVFEPHPTVAERRVVGEMSARAAANATQPPPPAVGAQRAAPASMPRHDARRRVEPPRDTTARIAATAADPVIRIHIGRVDVRAVTTGAPAAPTRARDPRRGLMTLDEYVQRGGRS